MTTVALTNPAMAFPIAEGAQSDEFAEPSPRKVVPRLIHEFDVPWMVALAKRRYSNRFDFQAGEMWVANIVLKQPMVFLPLRTDNAFCIGMISANPWLPSEWHAHVAMVCADDGKMWEALTLIRECVAWAKRRNCVDWRINSQTGYDIAPLARRVGAKEEGGCFAVMFQ